MSALSVGATEDRHQNQWCEKFSRWERGTKLGDSPFLVMFGIVGKTLRPSDIVILWCLILMESAFPSLNVFRNVYSRPRGINEQQLYREIQIYV